MSEQQLKFYLRQTKPMSEAAYKAGKWPLETSTFQVWWDEYTARLIKIYLANKKMFSGRDFSDIIPLLIDLDAVMQGIPKSGE